jgi:hypothetical protein
MFPRTESVNWLWWRRYNMFPVRYFFSCALFYEQFIHNWFKAVNIEYPNRKLPSIEISAWKIIGIKLWNVYSLRFLTNSLSFVSLYNGSSARLLHSKRYSNYLELTVSYVRGFDTRWGEFLNLPSPFSRTRPLGFTQCLTEMSNRKKENNNVSGE